MKSLLKTFLLFAALSFSFSAGANPVSVEQAMQVARTFLSANGARSIGELRDITVQTGFNEFYVLAFDGGFILVAADDCVVPILGYSLSSSFPEGKLATNVDHWLSGYEEQIAFYRQHLQPSDGNVSPIVARQWQSLLGGNTPPQPYRTAVSPLLTTEWDQDPYYNNACPYSSYSGSRPVTGCVATAMAQIMKYWNHPTTGYGSHSYYHDTYGTLSANFANTTYQWSSMPNSLSSSSTSTQVNAVATLMNHVGIAVDMDYSTESSGAQSHSFGDAASASAENALRNYFKYSPQLYGIFKEDYTDVQWCNLLKNELDDSRPILYDGRDASGGHAFVLDGYNNAGQFHINWGWGGWCNGYYTMGNLHPASGGTGGNSSYTFNMQNDAIIGIQPNTSFGSSTSVTVSSANPSMGSAYGSGSYPLGDTVWVVANANAGYRFVQWSDGCPFSYRSFVTTGGTITLSASFEPLSGDTLGYCGGAYLSAYGNSGTTSWGIKLPASCLSAGHDLKKVQAYFRSSGTYTLTVYTGTSSPTTTAYNTTFQISDNNTNQWRSINISSPVAIDGTKSVWIKLSSSNANYPAAFGHGAGNDDALLWGSSLNSIGNYFSFLIRGIFDNPSAPTDTCATISSFPFAEDFEDPTSLGCWTALDADGDGYGWSVQNANNNSTYAMGSASYINGVGALNPDNWLISPQFQLSQGHGYQLAWNTGIFDPNYYQEHYGVFVSTSGTNPSDFTLVQDYTINDTNWTHHTLDLSGFAGQTVYVAFRHYNCTDLYWMLIDDVELTQSEAPTTVPVSFVCTGNGSGEVRDAAGASLCGTTLNLLSGNTYSFSVIPSQCSLPSHVLINGVNTTLQQSGNTYSFSITPTAAATATVDFSLEEYTISTSVSPLNTGSVDGGGTYPCGSEVLLTAIPAQGYQFYSWGDGITDNPRTVWASSDLSFTANFVPQTAIDEADGSPLTVYPNPSRNSITVTAAQPGLLELLDLNGRTITSTEMSGTRTSLNISHLAPGTYLLRLTNTAGSSINKLIKY